MLFVITLQLVIGRKLTEVNRIQVNSVLNAIYYATNYVQIVVASFWYKYALFIAYRFIPYHSQPATQTRLIRSCICRINESLGLTDGCQHYSTVTRKVHQ